MGNGVLARARGRRERRHLVGPPRGGLRDHQPAPREHRLPAGRRAAAGRLRHPRHRAGAGRRRAGGVRRTVADLPVEPRAVGAVHPVLGGDGVADEGRRARHPQADERGDRRGHRRRTRPDRRRQRPQPLPRDLPARAGGVGGGVRRRVGRTEPPAAGALTGLPALHQHRRAWAASSAAPTRTSWRSRSGWRSGSASATTPRPR